MKKIAMCGVILSAAFAFAGCATGQQGPYARASAPVRYSSVPLPTPAYYDWEHGDTPDVHRVCDGSGGRIHFPACGKGN